MNKSPVTTIHSIPRSPTPRKRTFADQDVLPTASPAPSKPLPLEASSGTITPEPQAEEAPAFSNYDVLLLARSSDDAVRFAEGSHVGNNRFRVLLSLYRPRYLYLHKCGLKDECQKIVREIADAIRHEVVPNGKFYERNRDGRWRELVSSVNIEAVVRSALDREPEAEERHHTRPAKRPRRRPSTVSVDSADEAVASPKPFDVVCDSTGLRLKRGGEHVGNNRFQVLLDIREASYRAAGLDDKRKIVREVVDAVVVDSRSRFLRPLPSGMHRPMLREDAAAFVRNCLDGETIAKAPRAPKASTSRRNDESELAKLKRRNQKKVVLGSIEHGKRRRCAMPFSASVPTAFSK